MASASPEKAASAPEAAAPVTPRKGDGFLFKIIIVVVLLLAVMGGEFALLYFFLGGTKPDVKAADPNTKISETPTIGNPDNPGTANMTETEIDTFNCANGIASQGFTIHVTFRLVATVSTDVQSRFYDAVTKMHKHRVHEAVDKVIRSSSQEELKDANLDRIKRRIREDVNKVLGNSYIQDVIITEFRMMEQ
jgi:flagellar basal body-associated protein FliL